MASAAAYADDGGSDNEFSHAPRQVAGRREFICNVDLWVSNKSASLRKRKNNKRDSIGQSAVAEDSPTKKVRESRSWLNMGRSSSANPNSALPPATTVTTAGSWCSAICRLSEQTDLTSCTLSVYNAQDNTLQHSIYVHLLRNTDVRPVDRSLFFRPDCLGIHHTPGQPFTTLRSDPLYLSFASTDASNTWLSLLRSYARPEVYGAQLSPAQGGLYRMWRGVDMSILCGKGLGASSKKGGKESMASLGDYGKDDGDIGDGGGGKDQEMSDVYCEIAIDGEVCGRTTLKRTFIAVSPASSIASAALSGVGSSSNAGSSGPSFPQSVTSLSIPSTPSLSSPHSQVSSDPVWHESFSFGDLPPCTSLTVSLYKDRRMIKPALVGVAEIWLGHFRRGEWVEGWWSVFAPVGDKDKGGDREKEKADKDEGKDDEYGGLAGNELSRIQRLAGEIRMKIKFDEEIILPYEAYHKLITVLEHKNSLDLLSELESKIQVDHVAHHLLALATARNALNKDICELASREIENCSISAPSTLFRGNTIFTKVMEIAMNTFGRAFLEASIGPTVRRMCTEKVVIDLDPTKMKGGVKELEGHVKALVYWCQEFWKEIWNGREYCPPELRKLFQHIRQRVEKRFASDLRYQTVSSFCFLRFFVPAILNPHMFGLYPGFPPQAVQNSLKHVARVLQSLANLNANVNREEYMRDVKEFIRQNIAAMIDYIVMVSSPAPEKYGPLPLAQDKHDRLHITNTLRERKPNMATLYRESIPELPRSLDLPKHLAVLTSSVVRNARGARTTAADRLGGGRINEFTMVCYEIETQALQNVTRLAPSSAYFRHTQSGGQMMSGTAGRSAMKSLSIAGPGDLGSHAGRGGPLSPPMSPTMILAKPAGADSLSSGGSNHSTALRAIPPPLPPPPGSNDARRRKVSARPSTAPSWTSGSGSTDSLGTSPVRVTQGRGAAGPIAFVRSSVRDAAGRSASTSASVPLVILPSSLPQSLKSATRATFDLNASTNPNRPPMVIHSSSPSVIREGVTNATATRSASSSVLPLRKKSATSLSMRPLSITPPTTQPFPAMRRPSTAGGLVSVTSPPVSPLHRSTSNNRLAQADEEMEYSPTATDASDDITALAKKRSKGISFKALFKR